MKIFKISWGYRIAILYLSFVGLICFMVVMAMRQKLDLVSEDYYDKELIFQGRIDAANNANALAGGITHEFLEHEVQLQFPEFFRNKDISGDINFFRPSGSEGDYKCSIVTNENLQQAVPLEHLARGMYRLQVNCRADGIPYFFEQVIVIP